MEKTIHHPYIHRFIDIGGAPTRFPTALAFSSKVSTPLPPTAAWSNKPTFEWFRATSLRLVVATAVSNAGICALCPRDFNANVMLSVFVVLGESYNTVQAALK